MAGEMIAAAAPAKLNLDLRVFGRRADGLHEIDTIMTPLDFGDEIAVSARADGQICRRWTHPQVADDLCVRAARLLKSETGARQGADISVRKRIPVGGGLGGGSSDAAAVLRALNTLWKTRLSKRDLMTLAARLGADAPFFIFGKAARARGAGEKLTAAKSPFLQKYRHYLLVFPRVMSGTAAAYSEYEKLTSARITRKMDGVLIDNINDLAQAVFRLHPKIAAAARMLRRTAGEARLSGGGACVFAAFANRAAAENARRALPKRTAATVAAARDGN
ncbi:MAG: 4-(cytidine 5'-diphospho)-2-C-methyl-D-erythritol kinase [Gammaproteobacteria bacterium]